MLLLLAAEASFLGAPRVSPPQRHGLSHPPPRADVAAFGGFDSRPTPSRVSTVGCAAESNHRPTQPTASPPCVRCVHRSMDESEVLPRGTWRRSYDGKGTGVSAPRLFRIFDRAQQEAELEAKQKAEAAEAALAGLERRWQQPAKRKAEVAEAALSDLERRWQQQPSPVAPPADLVGVVVPTRPTVATATGSSSLVISLATLLLSQLTLGLLLGLAVRLLDAVAGGWVLGKTLRIVIPVPF